MTTGTKGNVKGTRGKGKSGKMTQSDFLPPPDSKTAKPRAKSNNLSCHILGSEHLQNGTIILVR